MRQNWVLYISVLFYRESFFISFLVNSLAYTVKKGSQKFEFLSNILGFNRDQRVTFSGIESLCSLRTYRLCVAITIHVTHTFLVLHMALCMKHNRERLTCKNSQNFFSEKIIFIFLRPGQGYFFLLTFFVAPNTKFCWKCVKKEFHKILSSLY